jgi:hypothetical protein
MRSPQDRRPSPELKRWHLEVLRVIYKIKPHEIHAAFDDRLDVVEVYRRAGIVRAEVLNVHGIRSFTQPDMKAS